MAGKTTFALIHEFKYESRLVERERVNSSEKPGYERKLIFWWEKVDFIKTPVDKVYLAFGGKIDVCTDTRI